MPCTIRYSDLEDAFEFVSAGYQGENSVYLCPKTGRFFFVSEVTGVVDELPDDLDSGDYLSIPHKYDFDLGARLASDFILEQRPEYYDEVRQLFRHKGAYSRYKALLERLGKLNDYYAYEERCKREALQEWCEDSDIELID